MKIQAKITINNKEYSGTIEADETAFAPAKERGIFRPKDGEEYWRIDSYGNPDSVIYRGTHVSCKFNLISNNCFRTREDAQKRLDVIHAENRIREYLDAHPEMDFEPDWGNGSTKKYFSSVANGEVGIDWFCQAQPVGINVFFATRELCDQFNKDNADDLKLIAEFGGFRR